MAGSEDRFAELRLLFAHAGIQDLSEEDCQYFAGILGGLKKPILLPEGFDPNLAPPSFTDTSHEHG